MEKDAKIYVAGHRGLVGSAIVRKLQSEGFSNLILRTHGELDLTRQVAVEEFFEKERPHYVFLCAAKVGGILANSAHPVEFFSQNASIALNIMGNAHRCGTKKLLNLGSSCIYPRLAAQPIREEYLLSGPFEPTNEAYALAKISAVKLCEFYHREWGANFFSAMPSNLYGPNDNFSMESGHMFPMVLRRFILGKLLRLGRWDSIAKDLAIRPIGGAEVGEFRDRRVLENILNGIGVFRNRVVVWGDGSVYREFMHSDDVADGCVFLMNKWDADAVGGFVNLTSGSDIRLEDLFPLMQKIVGFEGEIDFDFSKPNGMPRKLLSNEKLGTLGWAPSISLENGIESTFRWYCQSMGEEI
jgi:GDP-L-fucose synthase